MSYYFEINTQLQQCIKDKGGSVNSTYNQNNSTQLQWICDKEHQWLSDSNHIVGRKRWCPTCVHIKQKKTNQQIFHPTD